MLAATLQVAIDVALGEKNIWEENMKAHVVTLTAAIVAGGTGAAYAASATVNITAIDANGVGKQIGTLHLSDTKAGLQITPLLAGLPAADSQRPAWQRATTTIRPTPASTVVRSAKAIRAICRF